MPMSRSQVRAIKKQGFEKEYEYNEQYNEMICVDIKGNRIPMSAPHAPNQNEARVLRRLMSKTGLNEGELRMHKKYRKELSDAQKHHGDGTNKVKIVRKRLMNNCAVKLGLPHYDPKVKEQYMIELKSYLSSYCKHYRGVSIDVLMQM